MLQTQKYKSRQCCKLNYAKVQRSSCWNSTVQKYKGCPGTESEYDLRPDPEYPFPINL